MLKWFLNNELLLLLLVFTTNIDYNVFVSHVPYMGHELRCCYCAKVNIIIEDGIKVLLKNFCSLVNFVSLCNNRIILFSKLQFYGFTSYDR